MIGSRNIGRLAGVGFALTCVLVVGGMAWATRAILRLDRLESLAHAHKELDLRLRQALWRMDSAMNPILAVESGRPYGHYSACFCATEARTSSGRPADPPLLPSPLVQDQPPWVELYFQVTPDGHWSSPQLAPGLCRGFEAVAAGSEAERLRVHEALLRFGALLPPEELDARLAEARAFIRRQSQNRSDQWLAGDASAKRIGAGNGVAYRPGDARQSIREFQARLLAFSQQNPLPREICEPAERVARALEPQETDAGEVCPSDALDQVSVEMSVVTPFWLDASPDGQPRLVFARTVSVDGTDYYQGFVVDWNKFSGLLLDRVRDLFPDAALLPVTPDADLEPHSWLTTLPASLVIPSTELAMAGTNSDSTIRTLVFSWCTAVVALTALGFGLRSLVTLSHRRMQFAYAVAHELRTPLTTFRLYTDMLASGMVPATSRQQYLDTLNRESKRLGDLVNNVLEYARLENRAVRLNVVTTDGEAIVGRARESFGQACADEGVSLRTENALSPECPVTTDVDLLMCVTGVLVANACRHARCAEHPEIHLRAERANGCVRFSVIDNGPGVSPEIARQLYRPFRAGGAGRNGRSASGSGPSASGLGLGLTLARKWTHLLGGRLELASRQHPTLGGAEFRISLPLQQAAATSG